MKCNLLRFLCLLALLGLFPGGAGRADTPPRDPPDPDFWQAVTGPYGGAVAALAMSPNYAFDHTVFAGLRGGGLYRTVDWGQSWEWISGDLWIMVDLAISPAYADDGTVFATHGVWTVGYDVIRSTTEGDTWELVTPAWSDLPDPPGLSISPNFANDQTLYVLGGAQTYLSTNGGDTFVQASGWFSDHAVAELAFSPVYSTDLTLFALVPGDGLFKSTDGGTNWDPTGLSGDLSTFAVSPDFANDQMLLAVTAVDGQLYSSTDGGANWSPGALQLDPGGQQTLLFSPSFSPGDRVIMAASSSDPGPYRSTDGGATWQPADWHDPANSYPQGFVGGSVHALVMAPDGIWDPAAYAGTSAGIYQSYNRGENWFQSNKGLSRLTVRALDIAPGVPDTWLAGTRYFDQQRFDSSVLGEYNGNLQLTIDGGRTWHDVSGPLDRVNAVAFSPQFADDQTAFATAGTIGQHGFFSGGVYRSMDGGQNWEEVLGDMGYKALAVSPRFAWDRTVWVSAFTYSSALGIYASYDGGEVWAPLAPSVHAEILVPSPNYAVDGTLFAGTLDAGLQRSTNGGTSWTQVLNHPVTALAISPAFGASRTLYAGVKPDPNSPGDVYRSTDGGDTWQLVDTGIPDGAGDVPLTISTLAYACDGSVLVGIYYGHEMEGGGIYRSVDGGGTWEPLGYIWHHNNVFALASQPSDSITFFVGTSIGLWQLPVAQGGPAEPGAWESNGPRGGRADALAVSPDFANDGIALAGTGTMGRRGNAWGLGIFRSADGGLTWQPSPMEPAGAWSSSAIYDYAFSPGFATDQTVFAGTWGGLFKSTNGGEGWQQVYRAFLGWPGSLTEVALAPDYPTSGHLMGGSPWGGLYVSGDDGRTWSVDLSLGVVSEIAYSPDFGADATAFAAGFSGGGGQLFRTTDGALNWTPVLSQNVCSLAVSPGFAADGTLFAGGDALYISHDRGTTWMSATLPVASSVCPLVISPDFGADQTLFVGTGEGLYRSTDGGLTWSPVPGYNGPPIRSLAISPGWPAHPVLLIGGGHGVYRTEDGGGTWTLAQGMTPLSTEPLALAGDRHTLVTGAYHYGIYGSGDTGGSWSPLGLQESAGSRFLDVAPSPGYPADGTIFAAAANTESMGAGIYRTTDGGAAWQQVQSVNYAYRGALAISPHYASDQTVYAAGGGLVFASQDGGDSWSPVGTWPGPVYQPARIVALPANYPADGTLFAAGDGFWRLPPGATTWEPSASPLIMDRSVIALAVSPDYAHDATLLAAASWYEDGWGYHHETFRSTDGGVHWDLTGNGLPNAPIQFLGFSPRYAADRTAYLTSEDTLYRSRDGGLSWTAVGAAPEAPLLYDIAVDWQGAVYLGSGVDYYAMGNGVWRYTTPAQDILINGGFEADSGWEIPMTAWLAEYSQRVAFDGAWSMRVGVDNRPNSSPAYSSARQAVTVPADAISATLQCYIYPISGEAVQAAQEPVLAGVAYAAGGPDAVGDAVAAGDAQYLLLLDAASGDILEALFWQLSNAQRWQSYRFDLTPYAGRAIRLHFGVYNDAAGGRTGMYVDNVSLLVTQPAPAEPSQRQYLPIILNNASP